MPGGGSSGATQGALSGAATGAAAGSVVPGIGTVIGGAVGGIMGAIGGFLKGKSADEAEKAERLLYNEWLRDRSATIDEVAAKLLERGIDVYGPQVTTTSEQAQREMHTIINETVKPVWDKENQGVVGAQRGIIEARLGQPTTISDAEKFANLQRIAQEAAPALEAERSVAAQTGGTNIGQAAGVGSPAAAEAARQRIAYLGGIDDKERARRNEDLALANRFAEMTKGTKRKGRTDTFSTDNLFRSTTAPPDFFKLAELNISPGPQASMKTGYSPWGDALQQGGQLVNNLTDLYGQYRAGRG